MFWRKWTGERPHPTPVYQHVYDALQTADRVRCRLLMMVVLLLYRIQYSYSSIYTVFLRRIIVVRPSFCPDQGTSVCSVGSILCFGWKRQTPHHFVFCFFRRPAALALSCAIPVCNILVLAVVHTSTLGVSLTSTRALRSLTSNERFGRGRCHQDKQAARALVQPFVADVPCGGGCQCML